MCCGPGGRGGGGGGGGNGNVGLVMSSHKTDSKAGGVPTLHPVPATLMDAHISAIKNPALWQLCSS